jgi:predicted TIM-barrel fold metal-dependent hydrolase
MTRVDFHAHVLPPAYADAVKDLPLPPTTLEGLEAAMARHDIDAAVVSTGPPGAFLGDARARDLARLANEGMAEIVRGAPQRFAGLALLPLPDVDAALDELTYALDELSLDGVMLLTNVAGTYVGDPAWDALFAELDRRGVYVFLHPTFPPHPLPLQHPVWLYEFPFDTVRALAQLIYSGTLERHPSIRLQVAHLGGAAPFLAHRLASLADREPELAQAAPAGALAYLRRLYYDTGLSNNVPGLAATREAVGLDRVVFGTDWPYAALPADGGDPAPALDELGPDVRARVEHDNGAALVPRLVGAPA